ncbi:hypothetical protein [Streptomyces capparidis]
MKLSAARQRTALLGAVLCLLTLPFLSASPASADGGEWDFLGTKDFYANGGVYTTHVAQSSGGDFKACLAHVGSPPPTQMTYSLYEWDESNADDYVTSATLPTTECLTARGISAFVDGDNGKAEFYLRTPYDPYPVFAGRFWD